ncbi:hypothetical protein JCM10908_002282 [Rhodotorula pacifica]|uniref:uncharacterized protein n=1 Tax=Rhodotorula pacifica TaxID=1495444 RepID=UPI003174F978
MLTVRPRSGRPGATLSDTAADEKVLDSLAGSFARAKRVVVLVGAGISTNAGIPDFRSAGSGLYARSSPSCTAASSSRKKQLKGADMFNAAVYASPETAAEHLRFLADFKGSLDSIIDKCQDEQRPATETHDFMRLLKKRNKLLRVYTQNIDGLEGIETGLHRVPLGGTTPVPSSATNAAGPSSAAKGKGKAKAKLEGDYVQLHGTLWSVRCTSCAFVREWTADDHADFADGSVGSCPACEQKASIRSARGQRTLSSLDKAFLRPAITLYDESPPVSSAFEIGDLAAADTDPKRGADLMLVMGTSLRIPGFKALVKQFAKTVRGRGGKCILVNRDEMTSKSEWKAVFDYEVVMDSDAFVQRMIDGWKRTRPQDWSGQQKTLGEMFSTQKGVVKNAAATHAKPPPKKREPLRELPVNAISPRAVSNPQLATPPRSNRKRPRTKSFIAADDSDTDGTEDEEIFASSGRSRKKALSPRSSRPSNLDKTSRDATSRGDAIQFPSPATPGRSTRDSQKTHTFTLEITELPRLPPLPTPIVAAERAPWSSRGAGLVASSAIKRPFKFPRLCRSETPTPAQTEPPQTLT